MHSAINKQNLTNEKLNADTTPLNTLLTGLEGKLH